MTYEVEMLRQKGELENFNRENQFIRDLFCDDPYGFLRYKNRVNGINLRFYKLALRRKGY